MTTSENNKRIAKNTLMLYFRQILVLLVALYTSRVLLKVLGVSDYGVYNVVGGVVTLFGFFNGAMVSATQRFLAYDIGQNDYKRLRTTFNATQMIHFGLALFIFILAETLGLWFVKKYLVIPADRMSAALWVYHFAVLSFMVTVIQVPYNALVIAEERMSVYACISILDVLLKLAIVLVLPILTGFDPLVTYGVMLFAVAVIVATVYRIYVRKKFPASRFILVKDSKYYKVLLSYSGWNIFGNLAAVIKGQGVNMLMNIFFGPLVNAAQAVAHQVSAALNSFYTNFQMASNPQIIKSYASNDIQSQIELVNRTSRFSYYLLLVMSIPILIESEYILKLWLVTPPQNANIFVQLVLLNSMIDCLSGPLMTSIQATGKIKIYQSVVGGLLILNLPFTYLIYKAGYPAEYTYLISISISVVALVFRLFLTKKYIPQFHIYTFAKQVLIRCIIITLLSFIPPFLVYQSMSVGILRLITVTITALIVSFVVIYVIGISKSERNYLAQIISRFKLKMVK